MNNDLNQTVRDQTVQDRRVAFEVQTLAQYFPRFAWYQWRGSLFTEGPLTTNHGSTFGIRVVLPVDFPNAMPEALITHPKPLFDAYGEELASLRESAAMHLLTPHDGMPSICHYPAWTWGPHRTVYQVLVKARLWLEAYEHHLRHGTPLDAWLRHAPTPDLSGTEVSL